MSEFIKHTVTTAPLASKNLLRCVEKKTGFIPNFYAVLAESAVTLESYLSLDQQFDKSEFTDLERQLILLTISRYHNCCYCLASHSTTANKLNIPAEIVTALYYNQSLESKRLEALRIFTRCVLEQQGWVKQTDLNTFYNAGFQQNHVLEVVLAISFKTISNYINHINDTPIDTQFISSLPNNNKHKSQT